MNTKAIGAGRAIDLERSRVREILQRRYSPAYHHVMIDSTHRHGDATVVLYVVETSTYVYRRVGVIVGDSLENDIIAGQR